MSFTEHSIKIQKNSARYYQYHVRSECDVLDDDTDYQKKPTAHFYGGNSFVMGCYEPLIRSLTPRFNVVSLAMRGYWYDKPTANKLTREEDAQILIEFLEATQDSPIVGIGHSQGATSTALAAAQRPDLFHSLYLIEPVTFTKNQVMLYNSLPRFIKLRYEPFKSTLTKQSHWESVDDYYHYLRANRTHKRISDEYLRIYAEHSLIECIDKNTDKNNDSNNTYELLFSPEQELANYFGTPFIDNALKTLNNLTVPYQLITGKPSLFISNEVRKSWKKFIDVDNIVTLSEYGHLLPIEAPKLVADIIKTKHFN